MSTVIALMMKAARTSETSIDIQLRTRQYIPENSGYDVVERGLKLTRGRRKK
jgi:hypothetical protein